MTLGLFQSLERAYWRLWRPQRQHLGVSRELPWDSMSAAHPSLAQGCKRLAEGWGSRFSWGGEFSWPKPRPLVSRPLAKSTKFKLLYPAHSPDLSHTQSSPSPTHPMPLAAPDPCSSSPVPGGPSQCSDALSQGFPGAPHES